MAGRTTSRRRRRSNKVVKRRERERSFGREALERKSAKERQCNVKSGSVITVPYLEILPRWTGLTGPRLLRCTAAAFTLRQTATTAMDDGWVPDVDVVWLSASVGWKQWLETLEIRCPATLHTPQHNHNALTTVTPTSSFQRSRQQPPTRHYFGAQYPYYTRSSNASGASTCCNSMQNYTAFKCHVLLLRIA